MLSKVKSILFGKRPQPVQTFVELSDEQVEKARLDKLLTYITKDQIGLEIGPMHRPCAPKKDGYHVEIVDHMDQAGLVKRGKELGIPVEKIEAVDYIWNGGTYTETTGKREYYDYIIASHVLEHIPDLIGALNDCAMMLKRGGVLAIALPDKRYTLDHFRMTTTTGKIIDDHLYKDEMGSMGNLMDFKLNAIDRHGMTSWPDRIDPFLPKEYRFLHSHDVIEKRYNEELQKRSYDDIHQHVFTPASFQLIINDLMEYGLIELGIDTLFDTQEEEFICLMKKGMEFTPLSSEERMELIRKVSQENLVT